MWLFLTRRFRMWLVLTVLIPLASGLLRWLGHEVEKHHGPRQVSSALLKAGDLGDQARARLRGDRTGDRTGGRRSGRRNGRRSRG